MGIKFIELNDEQKRIINAIIDSILETPELRNAYLMSIRF